MAIDPDVSATYDPQLQALQDRVTALENETATTALDDANVEIMDALFSKLNGKTTSERIDVLNSTRDFIKTLA